MFCIAVMAEDNKSIAQREYWFDNDISTRQTLSENTTGVSSTVVSISGLTHGLHSFTLRVQDSKGVWSSPMTKYFVVKPTPTSTTVAACEYWFDNDVANRNTLGESVATVEMNGLTQGLHSFTMRVKNDAGVWSSPMTKYFLVPSASEMNGKTITRCQYWFDDARDQDNFADLITTCTLESENNNMVMVDIGDLPVGTHTIWWRVGDSKGAWSEPLSEAFTIELITTGVENGQWDSVKGLSGPWFTIDGKKGTGTMRKGVVIVNGKKIVIK
jgi:hypothetical protein